MPPIHRLLCTHCTFGTSELESSTTENAGKVFGYSVRKSSLPDTDRGQVRQLFRAIERLLSYYLPKDASAAQKAELSADSAPRRLIFVPNLGGWQVTGHVSYRSHDTAGRPGSYFADLLVDKAPESRGRDAASAWSPIDVVGLWSTGRDRKTCADADWWISSEEQLLSLEADGPWRPVPLATVADLRHDRPPLIDDTLLHRFLTAEPGSVEATDYQLVPERWWRMPAADRRSFIEAVLQATILGPARPARETVTIAAEPSVAAIVFFAVCRLLPAPIAAVVSFSTYESTPERPLTGLVATTFMDERNPAADLPPEVYQQGFACNTFRDLSKRGRTQAPPEGGYVRQVVDLAARAAWVKLDDFLRELATTEGLTASGLDALTQIDRRVASYMQCESVPKPELQSRSAEERFLRKRFCTAIESHAHSHQDWPKDLLDKAIDWLGDDLPRVWEQRGSIRDVLERRLPLEDNKLFLLLTRNPPAPHCVISAAVVAATRQVMPQALPEPFLRGYCDIYAKSDQRRKAARLILDVVKIMPDRDTILKKTTSLSFLDLLLESLRDLDKTAQKRLKLPLPDMMRHAIDTYKEKEVYSLAQLLERHAQYAESLREDGLRKATHDFLASLADIHYIHLTTDHHSLVPELSRWLHYKDHDQGLQDKFSSWQELHDAALKLDALRGLRWKANFWLDKAASAIKALKPSPSGEWDDNPKIHMDHARSQVELTKKTFAALKIKCSEKEPPLNWILEKLERRDHRTPTNSSTKSRANRSLVGLKFGDHLPDSQRIIVCVAVLLAFIVLAGVLFLTRGSSFARLKQDVEAPKDSSRGASASASGSMNSRHKSHPSGSQKKQTK